LSYHKTSTKTVMLSLLIEVY